MSSTAEDIDLKPEKMEQKEGESFHCDLYDIDLGHRIAEEFLPGLSAACIDNTTGGLFSSPAVVAVEIRREMVDYLIQRSENYVAESVVLETGPNEEISKDPYDIISDFIDDFGSSKRNFFSKVSGWVLSERREDRIDDFVQEMDVNGFWQLNRRESIVQTLLKNVDFKNLYHCDMSFKTKDELEEHKSSCNFRTMLCTNEGCNARFSAARKDNHDSECPFKILHCEQNCPEYIMRRDMDKHCITVCAMKLVKCPFYSVGCESSIPQSEVGQHRTENLNSHMFHILKVLHKEEKLEDLMNRVEDIIEFSPPGQLAAARDARSLTRAIKPLDEKLGSVKIRPKKTIKEAGDGKEQNKGSATKEVSSGGESRESGSSKTTGNGNHPNQEKAKSEDPPATIKELPIQEIQESQRSAQEEKAGDERVIKSSPSLKEESEKSIEEEKASGEHVKSPPLLKEESEKSIEEEKASGEHVRSPRSLKDESEKSIEEEKASGDHVVKSSLPAKNESEKSIEEEKASDEHVVTSPPPPPLVKDESEKSIEEEKVSNEHISSSQPVTVDQKNEHASTALDVSQSNNENSVADKEKPKESPPKKEQPKEEEQLIEGISNVQMNSVAEVDREEKDDNNKEAASQLQSN